MRFSKVRLAGTAMAITAVVIIAGCGGGDDDGDGGAAETVAAAPEIDQKTLDKLSPALATNLMEANQILDEGTEALDAKLADLKGTPVVVNQWASWCEPCRAEFPFFADSANQHQGEIAFVGIDMQDDRGAAETFVQEFPVTYPHIWDPDAVAISSLGGGVVSPTTVFIDKKGEVTHVFQGAYANRDQLEADIEEHLPSA
ncbi:MAG: TlpA family protein disulfide reductase [Solirubrobacterales bacterium]